MTNAEQLRNLMRENDLSRAQAAPLCGASIHTLNAWLLPKSNKAFRNMPAKSLLLMQLQLSNQPRK